MKTLCVNKIYHSESTGYPGPTQWPLMMEDIIVPLFSNFNNISYIGKNTAMSPPRYMFSIENSENVFLQMSSGNSSPSIRIEFCSSNDIIATNNSWIGDGLVDPSSRIFLIPPSTDSSYDRTFMFNFHYITDNNNNLKAWWVAEPTFGSKNDTYFHVLAKTQNNKTVAINTGSSSAPISCYFLDDPNHTRYYLSHWGLSYASNSNILKCSFAPIVTGRNNIATSCVDVINNDEDFVYIWNSNEGIYCDNSNSSPMNKKLIKIGNTYYRQLEGECWTKDYDGEDIITNITNETNSNNNS